MSQTNLLENNFIILLANVTSYRIFFTPAILLNEFQTLLQRLGTILPNDANISTQNFQIVSGEYSRCSRHFLLQVTHNIHF